MGQNLLLRDQCRVTNQRLSRLQLLVKAKLWLRGNRTRYDAVLKCLKVGDDTRPHHRVPRVQGADRKKSKKRKKEAQQ